MNVQKRLEKIYRVSAVIPFDDTTKWIIMSDCHRGEGGNGDNFQPNQMLYFSALQYYWQNGFSYIELGDGDELWENRDMNRIILAHSDVFWMLSQFYKDNRLYLICGNHDNQKRKRSFMERYFKGYYCDSLGKMLPLFPNIGGLPEGLILQHQKTKQRIFLVHGHQGSLLNDRMWFLARFLVRYVWGPLEGIGFLAPSEAVRSHQKKDLIEKELISFANRKNIFVIAGHTHRPYYPKAMEHPYFNDGSCVHPRCITGIEIEKGHISLVKWSVASRNDRSLFVKHTVLAR